MKEIPDDTLGKRLLALNQMHCFLVAGDGHIWIEEDKVTIEEGYYNSNLSSILKAEGISLNNKIYGGVVRALDTIDEALRLAKTMSLLERYTVDACMYSLDEPGGAALDRIHREPCKGEGGIF